MNDKFFLIMSFSVSSHYDSLFKIMLHGIFVTFDSQYSTAVIQHMDRPADGRILHLDWNI